VLYTGYTITKVNRYSIC